MREFSGFFPSYAQGESREVVFGDFVLVAQAGLELFQRTRQSSVPSTDLGQLTVNSNSSSR